MSDSQDFKADEQSWFGHPFQLAILFITELWERFGYYGMRAILTLYLAKHFLFNDRMTNGLYGGFTALVYFTPLIGGLIADRMLGSKRSVKFGAILMSLGYFILCFGGEPSKPKFIIDKKDIPVIVETEKDKDGKKISKQFVAIDNMKLQIKGNEDNSVSLIKEDKTEFKKYEKKEYEFSADRSINHIYILLLGLSIITIGNGFFKPNISTIVGSLYGPGDTRRDAGFTIFYMGINLGSLLSQIMCPFIADYFDWKYGFGLAAVGMLISWALITFVKEPLAGYGERPANITGKFDFLVYVGTILLIPIVWALFYNLLNNNPAGAEDKFVENIQKMDNLNPSLKGFILYVYDMPIMGKMLFITFLLGVPGILIWSFIKGTRQEFQMMIAAMVLIVFNVVFCTLFEQAGSSLTLFAERNTDLNVFGIFSVSAGQTQFFNAFFIVALAPVFSILWKSLANKGLEPSIPVKFAIALMGVGLGFLFLVYGGKFFSNEDFKVTIWWLAGLYLIHSVAELCISPVGLSMITKLSIPRIVGLMMGVWFLSTSIAQYVAGIVAQFANVETVGGQVTNAKVSLETYLTVFEKIGYISIVIGVVLLLLAWPLKKIMHGVK